MSERGFYADVVADGPIHPDPYPASKAAPILPDTALERFLRLVRPEHRPVARRAFLAGWNALGEHVRPMLAERDHRWWRQMRENDQLRARIGQLLSELSRLTDRG